MGANDSPSRVPLSVVILTGDEEVNIAQCLESVQWAAELFVVDSGSTDKTVEIAKALGAKVCFHAFASFAGQRNWALDNLPFSFEWVLMLDADEVIPQETATAIAKVVTNTENPYQGFYLNRRLFFWGRWLRHGGIYPSWILRLFKLGAGRFGEPRLNEHIFLLGAAGYLRNPFNHVDQRPLSDWISKHDRYADLEAKEYLDEKFGMGHACGISARLLGSQAERKRWIKLHIWNRLPLLARPFLFFIRNYLLRGGFLDGKPGFVYHVLWSFWYPFLTSAKILEKEAKSSLAGLVNNSAESPVREAKSACIR